jgi:uncharacterized membrane protein YphA (DoxX/SURF4 family)
MSEIVSRRPTIVPLILRLALAAIFIYHGLMKVTGPGNEAGAAWARNLWHRQGTAPDDVLAKIGELPGETPEKINSIQEELKTVYAKQEKTQPEPEILRHAIAQFAVAWGELVGGIALFFGFLTRLAGLGLMVIQVGAIYTVTGAKGFSLAEGGGYEYNLALLAMCLSVIILGGGCLAVDRVLFPKRKHHEPAPAMAVR